MSISRSSLTRGAAYINYNSVNFFTRDKISVVVAPTWADVATSMFGKVDKFKKDNVIKLQVLLWGAWENLSTLFPSYLLNPIPGTSIFGSSDVPLTIQSYDGVTFALNNAQITGLSNLYLGTDSDLFAAAVEFTGLITNSTNPETASSYTTRGTNAYSAATAAFAKTNFKKVRFTGAWGALTGFTSIAAQKGWQIGWNVETAAIPADGFGTVDMSVKSMIASATAIPIGPTLAQIKSNSQEEAQMGALGSASSADLTLTGNGGSPLITLKNAFLKSNRTSFDSEDLRVNECTWETTRGFTTGAPAVVASVA